MKTNTVLQVSPLLLTALLLLFGSVSQAQTEWPTKSLGLSFTGGVSLPQGSYADAKNDPVTKSGFAKIGYYYELGLRRWDRQRFGYGMLVGKINNPFKSEDKPCIPSGEYHLRGNNWEIPYVMPTLLFRSDDEAIITLEAGFGLAHGNSIRQHYYSDIFSCGYEYNILDFPSKWLGLLKLGMNLEWPFSDKIAMCFSGNIYYSEYVGGGKLSYREWGSIEETYTRQAQIKIPIVNLGLSLRYRIR